MKKYNLSFITDENLFEHVKNTVLQHRSSINLTDFNKNIIDPIKLTFDSKVYGLDIKEIIENECIRQIDKSNGTYIGYFHQNIFKYLGKNWVVPKQGFDIINENKNIFVELKNKHNTMNSSSSQKIYTKMQNTLLRNDKATCMLVEVIARNSQNITWNISLDGEKMSHERIRRVSIDKFYEIVTGEKNAFHELCKILPIVLDDVVKETKQGKIDNSVFVELSKESKDILTGLYFLSFKTYEGFNI